MLKYISSHINLSLHEFFLLFSHDGFLEMPLLGMGVIKLIHAYASHCSYKVQITYCRHLWLFICQYNHLKIANLEVKTSVLYTVYIYISLIINEVKHFCWILFPF